MNLAVVAVTWLAVVPLVAGIAPPSSDPPVIDEAPAGVTLGIEFPRRLQAERTPTAGHVTVTVDNGSSTALEFDELAVESPLFEHGGAESSPKLVPAGRRFDYPVPIGAAVCTADPPSPTVVVIQWRDVAAPVRIAVDDTTLRRINERECAARAVNEAVSVTLAASAAAADDPQAPVTAELTVTRQPAIGGEPVEVAVTAVRGSVLIELTPATTPAASAPLLTLGTSDNEATVPVSMRVSRCDPHAVTESKKTFRMTVWVRLGDGEEIAVEVVPTLELQRLLTEQIDACLQATTG